MLCSASHSRSTQSTGLISNPQSSCCPPVVLKQAFPSVYLDEQPNVELVAASEVFEYQNLETHSSMLMKSMSVGTEP